MLRGAYFRGHSVFNSLVKNIHIGHRAYCENHSMTDCIIHLAQQRTRQSATAHFARWRHLASHCGNAPTAITWKHDVIHRTGSK